MAFHVFVEGATDETPGALERLAQAIARNYGLAATDLLPRLQNGRFRVKGNTDRATADTYARDLTRLGARVTIEESAGPMATPPAGTPVVAKPATTKPPPTSALGAVGAGPSTTKPPPMASGLAAAFSGEMPVADLGALSEDSIMSLASLDGVDDNTGAGGSIGPPPSAGGGGLPASIGPAPDRPKADAKASPASSDQAKPLDLFAPPDADEANLSVDLADEDRSFDRKRASVPPSPSDVSDAPAPASTGRTSQPKRSGPAAIAAAAPVTTVRSKLGPLADERARYAAGVLLAVLLGFVPAHFIAKMKEESSDEAIDRKVIVAQQAADTPETYANLDRMRTDQLARKESEHRNAALIGFAIWALVGGGIAYGWFRKIPWDDYS